MSVESTEVLVETYGAAVLRVVHDLVPRSGGRLERGELYNHGVEGMLDAARRYDPELGVQLWTFVYPRVRGAIMDAIRQAMPLPGRLHRRRRAAEAAVRQAPAGSAAHAEATQRLDEANDAVGRLSADALSIARKETLGVAEDEVAVGLPHASDRFVAGVLAPEADPSACVVRVDQAGADEQYDRAEHAAALHTAMRQLGVQERMIVRGLYFEGRGLLELGAELGISKSWASRIHTRAIHRLRELMADRGYDVELDEMEGEESETARAA